VASPRKKVGEFVAYSDHRRINQVGLKISSITTLFYEAIANGKLITLQKIGDPEDLQPTDLEGGDSDMTEVQTQILWPLVRDRTTPIERAPLVDEI
jgi:hypothetical protein